MILNAFIAPPLTVQVAVAVVPDEGAAIAIVGAESYPIPNASAPPTNLPYIFSTLPAFGLYPYLILHEVNRFPQTSPTSQSTVATPGRRGASEVCALLHLNSVFLVLEIKLPDVQESNPDGLGDITVISVFPPDSATALIFK